MVTPPVGCAGCQVAEKTPSASGCMLSDGSPLVNEANTDPVESGLPQSSNIIISSDAGQPAGTLKLVVIPVWVRTVRVGVQEDVAAADWGTAAAPTPAGTIKVILSPRTCDPITMFTKPVYTPALSPAGFTITPRLSGLALDNEPVAGETVNHVPPSVVMADAAKLTGEFPLTDRAIGWDPAFVKTRPCGVGLGATGVVMGATFSTTTTNCGELWELASAICTKA